VTLSQFEYVAPRTTEEAVSALQQAGSVALAGGHHLLTRLKRREIAVHRLVDLTSLSALRGVERDPDGGLRIGALTTLTELFAVSRVDQSEGGTLGAVADAVCRLGDRQSRNRATVGGQLACGRTGNDLAAALMALHARVDLAGPGGERSVPLTELWDAGPRLRLMPAELVTGVHLEPAGKSAAWRSGYARMTARATLEAVCGVAAAVVVGLDGRVEQCRIAAVGAMARPGRLTAMEESVVRGAGPEELPAPPDVGGFVSDRLASSDYRRHMTRVLAGRALERALCAVLPPADGRARTHGPIP
jgi:aerobic carbon-monoxide dehydrogenase medium subunit